MRNIFRLLVLLLICAQPLLGQARVDRNVIFGMYSGLALLMDIHYPEKSNGHGIVFISGSGWHAPLAYSAAPLKTSAQVETNARKLNEAGYTVFSVNHRAAPRFRYPAAVEDAQRAVRFVRHNAGKYNIKPDRIGATGGSSGGHLVNMLATLDGKGNAEDPDPVNRESAKVQCVVARAAPSDLTRIKTESGLTAVTSFMGMRGPGGSPNSEESRTYREASPVNHISSDDAPILLIHGDADATVPFEQSELMEQAAQKAGANVKLLRIPGGGHGAEFQGAKNPPDFMGEMVRWFDRYVLNKE